MVGKTRIAATLIGGMSASRTIAIPDSKDALTKLDAADVASRDSVIFLDDIDRLIGAGGITDGSLRRLAAAGNIIVGTIRAAEYDRFQPTTELRPPEWDVLSVFERVFVNRKLSEAEVLRLNNAVSDRQVRERIVQTGLGEYVGAAEHIEEALKLGPSVSPVGYALVLGVADWQLAGMSAPVPASVLPVLARPYLAARNRIDLAEHRAYERALQWARREINPTAALLQDQESGCFTVYDYALDLLSQKNDPIPEATWPILIENATPADLISIGYTAQVTYRQPEVALRAWRMGADSGHDDVAPIAAFNLGVLFAERLAMKRWGDGRAETDADEAQAAYQQAIDSGRANVVARAAYNLAVLLEKMNRSGIREAYQRAIDSGDEDLAPQAAFSLGMLLERSGDLEGANAAFLKAKDPYGNRDDAEMHARWTLLAAGRYDDGTRQSFQRTIQLAIEHGLPDFASGVAYNLGLLLERQGEKEMAQEAYQWAADVQHTDAAAKALRRLDELGEYDRD